jgi:hypothetical protein
MAGMMAAIGVPLAGIGTALNASGNDQRKRASKRELKTAKNAVTKYGHQSDELATYGQGVGADVEADHRKMLDAFTGTVPGSQQFDTAQAARTSELNGAASPAFAGATGKGSGYADRFTRALMADRIARSEAAVAPLGFAAAQGDQALAEQQAKDVYGQGELARGGKLTDLGNLTSVTDAQNRAPVADIMGALPGRMAFAQRKGFWSRATGSALQEMGIGMAKSEGGGGMGGGSSGGSWWSKFTGGSGGGGSMPSGEGEGGMGGNMSGFSG